MTISRSDLQPAPPRAITAEVAADMRILQEFLEDRRRLIAGLFGRTLRWSWVRERLLREIALACSDGREMTISSYSRIFVPDVSSVTIRSELAILEAASLVILVPGEPNKRSVKVLPTMRLVNFYTIQMPRLRDEVLARMGLPAA